MMGDDLRLLGYRICFAYTNGGQRFKPGIRLRARSSLTLVASAFLGRSDVANFLSTLNIFPKGKQKDAEMYVMLAQVYPEKAGEIAESLANNIEDDDIGYLLSSLVLDTCL
jgi:hypothetical protein